MFISRLKSLIGGKFSRWLKSREAHDPEAVYEAAISDRIRRYGQLKNAAAGAIYMRNKQAGMRVERALEGLSYDEDLRALQEVRESIQQMLTRSGVNREIHGAEIDQKLEEIRRRNAEAKVQAELDDLKRSRRPPLVP